MKRFYLFCAAGMSTSLLASNMDKVAKENNIDIEVKAFPDAKLEEVVSSLNPDAILLGPQVRHIEDKVREKYGQDRPVMVIDTADYGNMNGERVLKKAIIEYKNFKKNL